MFEHLIRWQPTTTRQRPARYFVYDGATVNGAATANAEGRLAEAYTGPSTGKINYLGFSYSSGGEITDKYERRTRPATIMSATGWDCGSVWSQTFSFDAFGNITKSGTTSFQPTYYTATNHFNTLPVGELSYDLNGNLTSDSFHSYGWDAEGLNTEIDSSATSMIYDALGRWVERRNAGTVAAVHGPDGRELAVMIGQSLVGALTWRCRPGRRCCICLRGSSGIGGTRIGWERRGCTAIPRT